MSVRFSTPYSKRLPSRTHFAFNHHPFPFDCSFSLINHSAEGVSRPISYFDKPGDSSGTYFLLLPEVRPPSETYYDSSQNAAWDTYFNVS